MYESSVPVFTRYLAQLTALLQLAEAHVVATKIDPQAILQARLAPDMHPFLSQIQIADDFVLRTCAALAGLEKPDQGAAETSFAGLQARLARTTAFLQTLSPASINGSETRTINSPAGHTVLCLSGQTFLQHYALPNFFFHVSTAYGILRHMGVEIGKRDFDGFHVWS